MIEKNEITKLVHDIPIKAFCAFNTYRNLAAVCHFKAAEQISHIRDAAGACGGCIGHVYLVSSSLCVYEVVHHAL